MENNESKKDENSCNFYHQLHTANANFTKNSSVQIVLQISCMSEAPGPKKFGRVSSI